MPFDFLFFMECCDGDVDDLPPLEGGIPDFESNKIMETLAAGEGPIYIDGESSDFSQQYAEQLEYEWRNWMTFSVRKRLELTGLGFCRRNAGKGSIVLPRI